MPENRLAQLRASYGWGRAELAAFLGVHERTVYRYERGESQIPDMHKARLCDLFGVSLDHLMGRERDGGDDGPVAA